MTDPRLILLTVLLTADLDNPGYSWTRQPPTAPATRPVRQLRTDLDGRNLATDQKAGGSSPSERAQVTGPYPLLGGAFSCRWEPCWEPQQPVQAQTAPGSWPRRRPPRS